MNENYPPPPSGSYVWAMVPSRWRCLVRFWNLWEVEPCWRKYFKGFQKAPLPSFPLLPGCHTHLTSLSTVSQNKPLFPRSLSAGYFILTTHPQGFPGVLQGTETFLCMFISSHLQAPPHFVIYLCPLQPNYFFFQSEVLVQDTACVLSLIHSTFPPFIVQTVTCLYSPLSLSNTSWLGLFHVLVPSSVYTSKVSACPFQDPGYSFTSDGIFDHQDELQLLHLEIVTSPAPRCWHFANGQFLRLAVSRGIH